MKLLTPLAVKSQLGDGGKEQDGFHMWARAMTMSHGAKLGRVLRVRDQSRAKWDASSRGHGEA